jgi:hypothetical protein
VVDTIFGVGYPLVRELANDKCDESGADDSDCGLLVAIPFLLQQFFQLQLILVLARWYHINGKVSVAKRSFNGRRSTLVIYVS